VASAVAQANITLGSEDAAMRNRVSFKVGSAYDIKSEDKTFDLIIAGGATSFMNEKEKAVAEYYRVLKNWGYLSVAHLYYASTPPESVIEAVSRTIGVRIPVWGKSEWNNLFAMGGKFEQVWEFDNKTKVRTRKEIDEYVAYFLKKPHIAVLSSPVRQAIGNRWAETLSIFNENQKYTRYSVRLYRKPITPSEPELFPAEMNDAD
jgi:SAM-dependent methyltransferase